MNEPAPVKVQMEQHRGQRRNHYALKGLLSCPLSGYQISGLLSHFFKLRAEHVHLTSCVARQAGSTIGVIKIVATERDACRAAGRRGDRRRV
jgi:hypothetical protein